MIFKKPALVVCVLFALIICSCDVDLAYTFVNKSSYTVEISLSEKYKNEASSDAPFQNSKFSVSSNGGTVTKYVSKSDVDFTWTTYNASDSSKIQCIVSGSKATFVNQ